MSLAALFDERKMTKCVSKEKTNFLPTYESATFATSIHSERDLGLVLPSVDALIERRLMTDSYRDCKERSADPSGHQNGDK